MLNSRQRGSFTAAAPFSLTAALSLALKSGSEIRPRRIDQSH
jgi:hypothetical protein